MTRHLTSFDLVAVDEEEDTYRLLTAVEDDRKGTPQIALIDRFLLFVSLLREMFLLTLFSLGFQSLHTLHHLLLLDAQLFLLLSFTILATKIALFLGIVPGFRLVKDLIQRSMIILQRIYAAIFRLWHGRDGIERPPCSEQIRKILRHFLFCDVAHPAIMSEI